MLPNPPLVSFTAQASFLLRDGTLKLFHLWQKILALAILGAPSEFVSCSFQKVFIQEAATYALGHPNFQDCEPEDDMEFRDLPGDEWIEEGEEEMDEDDPLHEEDVLYEEEFNPRLMEMLGEEEFVDSDLR